ncbi:virginiamycin B lyase family protein [Mycolicibacterium vinylchloridicum]|uniref:virginiamycin B lyase family protein n=1 Tax=Mycolicibacterium vinylchloridicum TaxID=2736928 RepID=UPI0015C96EDF|nr:Ig-like domain-containing protein [Mycolicibacterium vinylchloridicum]
MITANSSGDPVTGFFHALGALLNNQTPTLNPHQISQTSSGVVSGELGAVDPDSPVLTYTLTRDGVHGSAQINADGTYTYTPEPAYAHSGTTDSFTVSVSDFASGFAIHGLPGLIHLLTFGLIGTSGATSTRTVTVTVAPFNTSPTLTLTTTSNPDGTTTIAVSTADADSDTVSTTAITADGHGTLTPTAGGYTYTPDPGYAHSLSADGSTSPGSDTVTVVASDGHGGTVNASTTLSITAVNSAPVITVTAVSDPAADGAVTITYTVSDPDNTASATPDPLTVHVTGTTNAQSLSLNGNSTVTYLPTNDARQSAAGTGPSSDVVTLAVTDGHGGSTTAMVTVTVSPAAEDGNQAPVVDNPGFTVTSINLATGVVTGVVHLSDPDGDPLTYTVPASTANGEISIDPHTGVLTYSPTATARDAAGTPVYTLDGTAPVLEGYAVIGSGGLALIPNSTTALVQGYDGGVPVLALYDLATNTVISTLKFTTNDYVGSIVVGADSNYAYAPTYTWDDSAYGVAAIGVSVIDTATNTVAATIPFPTNSGFNQIVLSPDGTHAYAPTYNYALDSEGHIVLDSAAISVIDTTTNTITATMAYPDTGSAGFDWGFAGLNPAGTRLYVGTYQGGSANSGVTSGIAVFDTTTGLLTDTIDLADNTSVNEIVFSPDGARAYINSCHFGGGGACDDNSHTVRVVDTTTGTVVDSIAIPIDAGSTPSQWREQLSPDGHYLHVLASNTITDDTGQIIARPGAVSVIDTTTNTIIATLPYPVDTTANYDTYPIDLAISPDGAHAYLITETYDYNTGAISHAVATYTLNLADRSDTFTVTASDGHADTSIAVSVPITAITPITATADIDTRDDTTGVVTGRVTVVPPAGDVTLTYAIDTPPPAALGEATIDPVTGVFTFTPTPAALVAAYADGTSPTVDFAVTAASGSAFIPVTVSAPVGASTDAITRALARSGSHPSAVAAGADGTIYVINSGANTLSVLGADGSSILSTIAVGASPSAVAVGPDGHVWVTNGADGTVTVLDHTGTTIQTTIDVGLSPTGLAVGADGSVFVANTGDGTLSVINTTTTTLVRTITVGGTPTGIAAGPDGRIYVADFSSNTVTVIDPTHSDALATIDNAGPNPYGIAVNTAGTVYLTHPLDNTVTVLTPTGDSYTAHTVTVGATPTAITLGANGIIYVTDTGANTVTAIDPDTLSASAITTGAEPDSITTGPNGNIYITDGGSNTLDIINSESNSTTSLPVGVDPNTVTVDRYGNLSVTNNYDNTTSVINHPATGTITTGAVVTGTVAAGTVTTGTVVLGTTTDTGYTINTGTATRYIQHVLVSPDGRYAYLTNFEDGTVSVINPTTGTATVIHVGPQPGLVVVSPDSRYAYVASSDGFVSVIDPATGNATIIGTPIQDGGYGGYSTVVVSPDSRYAYAYGYRGDGSVAIINPATGTATIIQTGTSVTDLVVSPNSSYAYAYGGDDGTVAIINPSTGTAAVIPTGIGTYTDLVVSPDSSYAYAYNTFATYDSTTRNYPVYVSIINPNTATATTIRTNNQDIDWQSVVVSPDSRYAYATTWDGNHNTVSIINPTAGTSTTVAIGTCTARNCSGTLSSFSDQTGVVVTSDSRYAYANLGGGTVAIINPATGAVANVDIHPNVQTDPSATYTDLVMSPDARYAYVASNYKYSDDTYSAAVAVITPATGTATIVQSGTDVEGVVVSPDSRYAYVYVPGGGVAIVNPVTGTATTINTTTMGAPVISPDSRFAYVIPNINYNSDTLSVIDAATGTATTIHAGMPTIQTNWEGTAIAKVVVSPDSRYAYVANTYLDSRVAIINPVTHTATTVQTDVVVDRGEVTSDGRYAYVIAEDNRGVFVGAAIINPVTGTATTVAAGAGGSDLRSWAISPDSRYAYFTGVTASSAFVSIIDTQRVSFPVSRIAPDYSTNTGVDFPVTFDPIANPFAPSADVTITAISQPANGTAVLNGSRITYTPNAGYIGTDTFTYTVTNGVSIESGTLAIDVHEVYTSVPYQAGPTGTQGLYRALRDAADVNGGNDLQHGIATQQVLVNGHEALIVYIVGTHTLTGDQSVFRNLPSALGVVDEDQIAVIKAAMTDAAEPILLVGYSQGGMDVQNIAANAAAYGLRDQIKAVVTFGSPLVQLDEYPTVHLEDYADPIPKINLTPRNWIAGLVNSIVNKNVYVAASSNDFDLSVLSNAGSAGVHGVRSTYEDVGLDFDVDTSSHWRSLRNAMAGFLNGQVVPDGYTVIGGRIVPAKPPVEF